MKDSANFEAHGRVTTCIKKSLAGESSGSSLIRPETSFLNLIESKRTCFGSGCVSSSARS